MVEMNDGTNKTYAPVGRCIYCLSTDQLSDEHVIPYALNGTTVLPKASCEKCRKVTGNFEQEVLRGPMRQVRVALGMQSRTKHHDAPKTKKVMIKMGDGSKVEVEVGFGDAPVTYGFPVFPAPGFADPDNYVSGIRMSGIAMYSFGRKPEEIAADYGAIEIDLRFSERYVSFAMMVAKIAYASIVGENGLKIFDGEPIILRSIRGESDEIGKWVGTIPELTVVNPGQSHRIFPIPPAEGRYPRLLIVGVQLFADIGAPVYGVVLGRTLLDIR